LEGVDFLYHSRHDARKSRQEVSPMDLAQPDPTRGLFGISVASELVGMQPQRTDGGTRRYSTRDLERLQRIGELLAGGLNLAGISMVLALEAENDRLRASRTRARR
jgi:hypothetical protein